MFSQAVIEKLGYYVYFLVDPRSNKTFYIGKGIRNRVFSHSIEASESDGEDESAKIQRINEIRACGQEEKRYILRSELSEDEAYRLESALIDYVGIDNLTNIVLGHKSELMTTDEVSIRYEVKEAIITDPVLIVNIHQLFDREMTEDELYEATRKWWVLSLSNCKKVKYVLSVYKGIIRQVYIPEKWLCGKTENGQERICFEGTPADQSVRAEYVNCSVLTHLSKGAQNPIKYVNC